MSKEERKKAFLDLINAFIKEQENSNILDEINIKEFKKWRKEIFKLKGKN